MIYPRDPQSLWSIWPTRDYVVKTGWFIATKPARSPEGQPHRSMRAKLLGADGGIWKRTFRDPQLQSKISLIFIDIHWYSSSSWKAALFDVLFVTIAKNISLQFGHVWQLLPFSSHLFCHPKCASSCLVSCWTTLDIEMDKSCCSSWATRVHHRSHL